MCNGDMTTNKQDNLLHFTDCLSAVSADVNNNNIYNSIIINNNTYVVYVLGDLNVNPDCFR